MKRFRNIVIYKLLKETCRNFFAVRFDGTISDLYKYLLCCLMPVQNWWNEFVNWREIRQKIAYCKWQKGQLINFLNWYFDQTTFDIDQNQYDFIFVPEIDQESTVFAVEIDQESIIFVPEINDPLTILSMVVIKTPADVYNFQYNELESLINQIKIDGIYHQIESL